MSLNNLKTVVNDLEKAHIFKAEIRVAGSGKVIESVPIKPGSSHTFTLGGLGATLVLVKDELQTVTVDFNRNGENQVFYASQYIYNPPFGGASSEAGITLGPGPVIPPIVPLPTLTGLRTVINDLKDITIKAEVGVPGLGGVHVTDSETLKPAESHTFQLGPIGVTLALVKPGGEPRYVKLGPGNQIIYATKVFEGI